MKTLGIVQACHVAPSHQQKVARKLGGKTLLEWVARQASDCQRIEPVIVLLGNSPAERELGQQMPPDLQVMIRPETDALARFSAALAEHGAPAAIRICADNPFVDPVLIDRLVSSAATHRKCDYLSYCSSDKQPTILSPLGPFAEWCSADAITRANAEASRPVDRQEVTRYLYSNPDKFQLRLLKVPSKLDRSDIRLRIDGQEDWEHIQVIYDALGPEEWDWERLTGLLEQQAKLRKRRVAPHAA